MAKKQNTKRQPNDYRSQVKTVAAEDVALLTKKGEDYADTWKAEGGYSAFFNIYRKWQRIYQQIKQDKPNCPKYDVFAHIAADTRQDGIIDDIKDLRCYLLLIEAEMRTRGQKTTS